MEDSHGNKVTERVGQVVYTAKEPLPDAKEWEGKAGKLDLLER